MTMRLSLSRAGWARRLCGPLIIVAQLLVVPAAGAQQVLPSFAQVRAGHHPSDALLLDRHGEPLADIRFDLDTRRMDWLTLSAAPPALREALLAAEDKRFFEHTGVDWVAVASAAWQNLWGSRRGASTLTMQLAGLLEPTLRMPGAPGARRSVGQKWDQGLAAVALEKQWTKPQILEAYLNLAPFRGDLQGVGAASEILFGKSPAALTHKEACILAALLRGPNAKPALVARRACLLATKLGKATLCGEINQLATARLDLPRGARYLAAPHLARAVLKQAGQRLTSNLDATLQRKLLDEMQRWNDPGAAAIMLDNASGEVLAWVGRVNPALPDGVSQRRTLPEWSWPHLAALGIERRQLTAATPLSDALAVLDARDARLDWPWASLRQTIASHRAGGMRQLAGFVGREAMLERLRALGVNPGEHGESADEVSLAQLAAAWRSLLGVANYVPPRLLPGDNGLRPLGRADAAFIALDLVGQSHSASWEALWLMPGEAAGEMILVGSSEKWTLAVSARTTLNPRLSWQGLLRALGAETPRRPPPPDGLQQALVYFDPSDEPPRREWFMPGPEPGGLISYLPGRRARILEPSPDSVRALTGAFGERWEFLARTGVPVRWSLDGRVLGEGERIEWVPRLGRHQLRLLGSGDEVLDSVVFEVMLPAQP
ncbi:MAG: transglycosylase domain-containing protein [Uliginosibacterium sp.]|nr:transglycosylase domain-containing protein [Uliginosibacterium sp.]